MLKLSDELFSRTTPDSFSVATTGKETILNVTAQDSKGSLVFFTFRSSSKQQGSQNHTCTWEALFLSTS